MPRLFLAIPIPASIARQLATYQRSLDLSPRARLLTRDHLHVTVCFLGDVDEGRIPALVRTVRRSAAGQPPFTLHFERVEENGRGHVWARFAFDEAWQSFWRSIATDARPFIEKDDGREQQPHITLARLPRGETVGALPPLRLLAMEVRHFELWRSTFTPDGSAYTSRATFPLRRETDFAERVRAVVRSIPRGEVRSYGDVARLAGRPGAARAVGSVMAGNMDPTVPCHRVIAASGRIGDFNRGETPDRGTQLKIELLKKEGVEIVGGRVSHKKSNRQVG